MACGHGQGATTVPFAVDTASFKSCADATPPQHPSRNVSAQISGTTATAAAAAAVALTEFGSDCDTYNPGSNPSCANQEVTHLRNVAAYLMNTAASPTQYRSKNRNSVWFWWSWNANSGDTGGVVASNWYTVKWFKVRYLEQLGLCPWYRAAGSCVSAV